MPAHTFTFTTWLYRGRNEREYEVEVEYGYTPGRPGSMYGPMPCPDDPAEVEILSVKHDGAEFDTSREEDDKLYDEACDRAGQDYAEWCADAEEYRAECRAERWADPMLTAAE